MKQFIYIIILLFTFAGVGCSGVTNKLDVDVATACEEVGKTVECNSILYNQQATAIILSLNNSYELQFIDKAEHALYLDLMKVAATTIDTYSLGLSDLSLAAANMTTVYLFLLEHEIEIEKIIDIF